MPLITDPAELARMEAEHEAYWAKEAERMEWQKEFAEGHMKMAKLMRECLGKEGFSQVDERTADYLLQCDEGLLTYDEYLERSLRAWEKLAECLSTQS